MKKLQNPYAPKSNNQEYNSYCNIFFEYFEKRGKFPFVYEINSVSLDEEILENSGFSKIFSYHSEKSAKQAHLIESCYEKNGLIVQFLKKESILDRIERLERDEDENSDDYDDDDDDDNDFLVFSYSCKIFHKDPEELEFVLKLIKRSPKLKKTGGVYLLCSMDGMLQLQKFKPKLPSKEIDIDLNYGPEAKNKFEKIVSIMKSKKNGLILFSGIPGTGKSTFIKLLSRHTERKLIFLSSSSAEHITNPDFLTFIMRHRNSILILEDAEKVLRSREEQDNFAVSNLLNITDGILGDCINLMVIATFNIDREKIDKALLRKGRLLLEHHFEPLQKDMANKLLEKIGVDRTVSEPTSLAEIYNQDDNFHEEKKEKKIGF